MRTFSGFISRWKNPWAWICCNADTTCHLPLPLLGRGGLQYNLHGSSFEGSIIARLEELIEIYFHEFHDEMKFVGHWIQECVQYRHNMWMSWDCTKTLSLAPYNSGVPEPLVTEDIPRTSRMVFSSI
jgi:hypothetical protein